MFQTESIVGIPQCRSVQAAHAIGGNRNGYPLILLNSVLGVGSMLETDINGETLLVEILYSKTDDPFFWMFYKQILQDGACLWGDD